MALDVQIEPLENTFLNYAQVTPEHQFIYPHELEISGGDLLQLVDYHRNHFRDHYIKEREYFRGKHKMVDAPHKPPHKPDNRLIVNFPRKAVTTYNGFFAGTPVKIDHENEATDEFVKNWLNKINFDDVFTRVSKQASMYGHSYFYVYQGEKGSDFEGVPILQACDPLNTFLIYDDTLSGGARYGVTYRYNYERKLEITLYDSKFKRTMIVSDSSGTFLDQIAAEAVPYPIVPIIEAPENDERMALCEDIISLIDALDKVMSEKANDTDYFADAYLKIVNAAISKKGIETMRDTRVINAQGESSGNSQIEFLAKPDADNTQEHLVDRLVDYIYEIANVTNLNDDAFSGNPSGVALKLKYQAMSNMASDKSLKFKRALRDVFRCVFAVTQEVSGDSWEDLQFKFTQAIPNNLMEESQVVSNLYGKVSNHTLFKVLPFVDDPDEEIKRLKDEQQENQAATAGMIQQALAAQTDQQKSGGVADANNGQAGTKANSPTNQAGQSSGQGK